MSIGEGLAHFYWCYQLFEEGGGLPQILSLFELQLSIFRSSQLVVRPPMASCEVPSFSFGRRQPEHHLFYLLLWWYFPIQWTLSLPPLPMCLTATFVLSNISHLVLSSWNMETIFSGILYFCQPYEAMIHLALLMAPNYDLWSFFQDSEGDLSTIVNSAYMEWIVQDQSLLTWINSTLSRSVPPYIVGLRRSKSI